MKFFLLTILILSSIVNSQSIDDILKGKHRSEKNRARDIYRNPKETLNFFGIKNDMTVVELSPGGGWYQEIIGPYLRKNGKYISASYDPESKNERTRERYSTEKDKLNNLENILH